MAEENYAWFAVVNGDALQQGDVLEACPVVVPKVTPDGELAPEVSVETYDVVVLTQSCELENDKADFVLVCPLWSLEEVGEADSFLRSTNGKEALRRGQLPGYHLLNKSELRDHIRDFRVVDFRRTVSLPIAYVTQMASRRSPRLRLLPPYREHLAQAFARFFMRVGLPVDIPPFRKK